MSVIYLTVRAGSGGREAESFALLLFRMYERFAMRQKIPQEIVTEQVGDGGLREGTLKLTAPLSVLQPEEGVHRLQRVSPFGKGERHTSFATVEVIEVSKAPTKNLLLEKELSETYFKGPGPGGQNRNKVETGVRLRHLPSGLQVTISTGRSQWKNRELARELLLAKLTLFLHKGPKRLAEGNGSQWGQQIRTYAFAPKRQVIDHRSGKKVARLEQILDGDLDLIR